MAKIIDLDKVRAGVTTGGDITPGGEVVTPGGPTGTDAICTLYDNACDPGATDSPCYLVDWACGGYGGYDAPCGIDHACG